MVTSLKFKKYFFLFVSIFYFVLFFFIDETKGLNKVAVPTCYDVGTCKNDIYGTKWELTNHVATSDDGTYKYYDIAFTNNATAYTGTYKTDRYTLDINFKKGYFLNQYYGLNRDLIIFQIYKGKELNASYLPTQIFIVIDPKNNTVNQLTNYVQDNLASALLGNAFIGGGFSSKTVAGRGGGEFFLGNVMMTYNAINTRIRFYTFSDLGVCTLFQEIAPPSGWVRPMMIWGAYEGNYIYSSTINDYVPIFFYTGIDNKTYVFNYSEYSIYSPTISNLYALSPGYQINGNTTKTNILFGYSTAPYGIGLMQQLSLSNPNAFSSVFDSFDYARFSSGGLYPVQNITFSGSKIYISQNSATVGTCLFGNTWGANANTICTKNSDYYEIYSYDVACKTPLYDTCKVDIINGLSYCANNAGVFSPDKELCNDPALNIVEPLTEAITGGGGTIQQTKPSTYIKNVDQNNNELDTGNCLYVNPLNTKFSNNVQFCRIDDLDLTETYKDYYNKLCSKNANFYYHGDYNTSTKNLKLKLGICSVANDYKSIVNFRIGGNNTWNIIPNQYLSGSTNITETYSIITTANGIDEQNYIGTDLLNQERNIFNKLYSSYTYSGTVLETNPLGSDELPMQIVNVPGNKNNAYFSLQLLYNTPFYDSCVTDNCGFYDFTNTIKKIFSFYGNEFVYKPGIIKELTDAQNLIDYNTQKESIDNSILSCDSDNSGDVSIIEATICPYTILNNLVIKLKDGAQGFYNIIEKFMKIGDVESTPLFGSLFYSTANAGFVQVGFDSATQHTVGDSTNFFGQIYIFLWWSLILIFFLVAVLIILNYKK